MKSVSREVVLRQRRERQEPKADAGFSEKGKNARNGGPRCADDKNAGDAGDMPREEA